MPKRRDIAPAPQYGFPANAKGFLFPPVVWAIYFVLIYSAHGAGCAATFAETGALRLILTGLTVLTAVAILAVGVWSALAFRRIRRTERERDDAIRQSRFLAESAALNAGLFFVATLWIGLPIAWTSACG